MLLFYKYNICRTYHGFWCSLQYDEGGCLVCPMPFLGTDNAGSSPSQWLFSPLPCVWPAWPGQKVASSNGGSPLLEKRTDVTDVTELELEFLMVLFSQSTPMPALCLPSPCASQGSTTSSERLHAASVSILSSWAATVLYWMIFSLSLFLSSPSLLRFRCLVWLLSVRLKKYY